MFHDIKLHRTGNEERCIDNAREVVNFLKNLKPRYRNDNTKNQTTSKWDELASKMTDTFEQWETPHSKQVKLENQTIKDEVRIIVFSLHKLILSCNQLCIFVALAEHFTRTHEEKTLTRTRRGGTTEACQVRAKANQHWQRCEQLGCEGCGHRWKDDEEFRDGKMIENSCDLNTMITWEKEIGTTALLRPHAVRQKKAVVLKVVPWPNECWRK